MHKIKTIKEHKIVQLIRITSIINRIKLKPTLVMERNDLVNVNSMGALLTYFSVAF